MNVGKSLAESIEGATTAYYRDGGGTETGIAADERLVEALKQAYIAPMPELTADRWIP